MFFIEKSFDFVNLVWYILYILSRGWVSSMLTKKNSLTERIISFFMTVFALILIVICIKERMPHSFWGIIKFIYSSVI